ncbi:MAG TPA: zinc protease [Legionellales bacterium]|nr:zinc protease [Legionellales bacterium]|tara:strand:+ start:657 stop:2315 length:1659 start_codon:yes stop_codon:yes gene_type:complete
MKPQISMTPLAACLMLLTTVPSYAAKPVNLTHTALPVLQQQFLLNLPGMKQVKAIKMDTLEFIKARTDNNHVKHIRMRQEYQGIPVRGGYAIMHAPASSAKAMVSSGTPSATLTGRVYQNLKQDLGEPPVHYRENADNALAKLKAQFAGLKISEEHVAPIIYLDDEHKAHWAYKVSFLVTYTDKIPERPTAILDAESYKEYLQWNDIKTAETNEARKMRTAVQGTGFGGNVKTGQTFYGKIQPFLSITRSRFGLCYMENSEVRIVDMLHRYESLNRAMQFRCSKSKELPPDTYWTGYKGDGLDRANGAYAPSNDALYFGYVIKHMYHDWYGVEVLTKSNGNPMQLVMRVHYGLGYENAYWDGSRMTFGDGGEMLYPLVSLEIGAHEVSHGFTEQNSNLEYYGQSGGLNESFSDMASKAAQYYANGSNTWEVGADIMKEDSGMDAMRYMDMPSRDGMSIDSADDYYNGIDVHFSSGVYNRMFYLLATSPNWNPRQAFDVMVKANMDYWTPYVTFNEASCGVLSAAQDLKLDTQAVKQAMDKVAVNYSACRTKS